MTAGPLLAALVAILLFPGCIEELVEDQPREPVAPSQARTLHLSYTLEAHVDRPGSISGKHCPTASIREGIAHLEVEHYYDIESPNPLMMVEPTVEGSWASTGWSPFWQKLPGPVSTDISGESQALGSLDWHERTTGGVLVLDGEEVPLPHEWDVHDDDGKWSARARIAVGPDEVQPYQREGLCI